jgi:translation initiation factor IF-1
MIQAGAGVKSQRQRTLLLVVRAPQAPACHGHSAYSAPYAQTEHERGESVSKDDLVQLEGKVISVGKGGTFTVEIEGGHQVMAKLAGKMRRARIRVVLGDEVRVAVSPYDPSHGLIVYRKR